MKIGCIIQARMSSSRLAGKVAQFLPFDSGITVLEQVIRRVKKSKKIDKIIVATTTNEDDNEIIKIANREQVDFYRGLEENVLSRYYLSAKKSNLDIIVRITSDCPCIDWEIIDELIQKHIKEKNDYTTNALKRSFPHGLDAEIINFKVLEEAYNNAKEKFEIEHVTPYIYKSHSEKFKIGILEAQDELRAPNIRITLDTKEDYILLCAVYDFLYMKNRYFRAEDIIKLFNEKKWLYNINNKIEQKKVCKNLNEEIDEAIRLLNNQDLDRAKNYLKEKYYG
ncbi:glycosyltransferase family protein [Haliovirga abyssi]|uniref:Acylneuraminate cytidylyltransferase n=1 Tax=Haliovirga abyssi TaxID=2996794 RepID=A0AAU9D597_9FUSO|nr:glycosyltransferase family protein [Haliovirga abyssi]BDU51154.1 hypothetical protein HLVA_17230 [Haliovirga abyssi]